MSSLKDRLKEILIRDDLISQENLNLALEKQNQEGGQLSKILVGICEYLYSCHSSSKSLSP